MQIIKRDGSRVDFDRNKITIAIKKALEACDMSSDNIALSVTEDVVQSIGDQEEIDQERVQDLVEDALMNRGLKKVAKAYIKYRYRHAMVRNSNIELINGVLDKLSAKHVVNQNANVDEASFGGRLGEAASFVLKKIALDFKMSDIAKQNHENNIIYTHDLDHVAIGDHNCLSIPFDKLLRDGFVTRQTDVRGAQSINTAFQLMAVIFQLQSLNQFGGVAATHMDYTMVPYVRKSFKKHYLRRALEAYMDHELDCVGGPSSEPNDEMAAIEWKFPTRESWYALDDENLEHIEKAFNKWYMDSKELTEDDFTFTSDTLDPLLKQYAIQDTRKETYQAIEAFTHNMNTLQSRSGNQLPFSSVNFGTCTLPEGRMVTEMLLRAYMKGTGKHGNTPIFPCAIYILKDGINKKDGDPNYDLFRLALKCTSLRLYPNYANGDWSAQRAWVEADRKMKQEVLDSLSDQELSTLIGRISQEPEVGEKLTLLLVDGKLVVDPREKPTEQFSTMGCRTANGFDVNALQSYKIAIEQAISGQPITMDLLSGAQKDGRGNICPVTIILPELAMIANKDVEVFFQLLEQKIVEAKDQLIERYELICDQTEAAAKFMYLNHTMAGYIKSEGIRSALQHGTLAIGQLGVAETLQLLIGKDQTTAEGMELAKRIEQTYSTLVKKFRKEYSLNFGVYYSPAESLCYTALKKFQAKYGRIPNVSDKEFFTNSMHVPVWKKMDPFKKIDIESELLCYSTAGAIGYVELDVSVKNNIDGLETLVLYAMAKDVPYFAINVPNDHCETCGYIGDIPDVCPKCGGSDILRLRRVTGYLSQDYHNFNAGKVDEVEHRQKHIG